MSSSNCLAQGPPPPPSGDYIASGHGNPTTGVTRLPGYSRGNCAHCHEQHASVGGSEPSPVVDGPADFLLFTVQTGVAFCTECHDSNGPASSDIGSAYNGSVGHGNTGGINTPIACVDCHDPHFAGPVHTMPDDGNDATKGAIKGSSGVSAAWSTPPAPAPGQETLSAPTYSVKDPIDYEYQLCLKCHSNYQGAGWPPIRTLDSVQLTDQGKEFNPFNFSSHPVTGTGTWKNAFLRANHTTVMTGGWQNPSSLDKRMHCSDCHGGDGVLEPKGPHGSNARYMLKAIGAETDPADENSYDNLCRLCHLTNNQNSNFGSHTAGAHGYDGLSGNAFGCTACHGSPKGIFGGRSGNMHGTNYKWPDEPEVRGTPQPGLPAAKFLVGGYNIRVYTDTKGGSSCAADESIALTGLGSCSMGDHGF